MTGRAMSGAGKHYRAGPDSIPKRLLGLHNLIAGNRQPAASMKMPQTSNDFISLDNFKFPAHSACVTLAEARINGKGARGGTPQYPPQVT